MNKYIILCSIVFVNCFGCNIDNIMINGSKWSESKIFKQFLKLKPFDYEMSYHNFSKISGELHRISNVYPNISRLFSLGKTAENRDIFAIILSNNTIKGRFVVLECGVHAREWISVSFCLWTIDKLLRDSVLLESYQFLIIPVLNPDGYAYSWETHRLWRKNRDQFKDLKCPGTDINRNWDTHDYCVHSSMKDSCGQSFCGETPFSSVEAKALSDYLISKREELFAYFSIHSYSQLWIYPWAHKNDTLPNAALLEKLASIGVNALHRMYGTEYRYGSFTQLLYRASGVSIDWVYDTLNVSIVFAIELRDRGEYGFLLPCYFIKPVSEETWAGIDAVLKYLSNDEPFETNDNDNFKNGSGPLFIYSRCLQSLFFIIIAIVMCLLLVNN